MELVEGASYLRVRGDALVFEAVHDNAEQVAVVPSLAELVHEGGDLGQPAGSHLQGCGTRHGLEHPGLKPGPHTLGRQAENPGRSGHRNTGDFGETTLADLGEAVAHGGPYRVVGQGGVEVFDVGHGVLGHGGTEGGGHRPILTVALRLCDYYDKSLYLLVMPGYQLYALRAALEPCRPAPRQISANGIAAARDGMSGVTGFRVVRVCHRVISNWRPAGSGSGCSSAITHSAMSHIDTATFPVASCWSVPHL